MRRKSNEQAGDNYSDWSGPYNPVSQAKTHPLTVDIDDYIRPLLNRGFIQRPCRVLGRSEFQLQRRPYSYVVVIYTPMEGFRYSTTVRWVLYKTGADVHDYILPVAEGCDPTHLTSVLDKQLNSLADNIEFGRGSYNWWYTAGNRDPGLHPNMDDTSLADTTLQNLAGMEGYQQSREALRPLSSAGHRQAMVSNWLGRVPAGVPGHVHRDLTAKGYQHVGQGKYKHPRTGDVKDPLAAYR